MKAIGIIPARMASTRFPGKPLVRIMGIPMIGHVYYRTRMSKTIGEVYIATCDDEIKQYAESIGAACIMTSNRHERASDRIAEAQLLIESTDGKSADACVMVQGDEPLLNPEVLDSAVDVLLKDGRAGIVNVIEEIKSDQDFESSDVVKVVVDKDNYALYYSREPIPSRRKVNTECQKFKQTGLIVFRRNILMEYCGLPATPLEIQESVDMLRVIEHGGTIKIHLSEGATRGVDTLRDLEEVEKIMNTDPLYARYKRDAGESI